VACKGCERRRAKIAAWFRDKLGVTPHLERAQRADRELALAIDANQVRVFERCTAVENEMRKVYQQQAEKITEMDEAASKWFIDVEQSLATLKAKVDTQQTALRNERADRTEVADRLADLSSEVSEMSETLTKLEFPEFDKIDVSLDN